MMFTKENTTKLKGNDVITISVIALKSIIISMFIGAVMITAMVHIKEASAANIKSIATIEGDYLRVGDIFENASEKADRIIGRAPQPGQDMVLNARTLMRIARATNISWQPQSVLDQVIVRREANKVPVDMVDDAIKAALSRHGFIGDVDLSYNDDVAVFSLPKTERVGVEIASLNYRPEQNMFEASLVLPSLDNPIKRAKVTGYAYNRIEVPVLSTPLQKGDLISTSDVSMMKIRANGLPRDVLVDSADLQGMAAARSIQAGKPLRAMDVALPKLVDRGDLITVIFSSDLMRLTAKGKALQNGTKGEMIRIVNLSSNKNLTAMVTGDNEVTIY